MQKVRSHLVMPKIHFVLHDLKLLDPKSDSMKHSKIERIKRKEKKHVEYVVTTACILDAYLECTAQSYRYCYNRGFCCSFFSLRSSSHWLSVSVCVKALARTHACSLLFLHFSSIPIDMQFLLSACALLRCFALFFSFTLHRLSC